jgi:small subunit ribosomal protein S1
MSVSIDEIDITGHRIALSPAKSLEEENTIKNYMADQEDDDSDTYNPFAALLKKKK